MFVQRSAVTLITQRQRRKIAESGRFHLILASRPMHGIPAVNPAAQQFQTVMSLFQIRYDLFHHGPVHFATFLNLKQRFPSQNNL